MEHLTTKYFLKKFVFETEDSSITELLSVTKEINVGTHIQADVLCSSLKETPIERSSEKLKASIGEDIKIPVTKLQALRIVERFRREGAYTIV
ncbi:hypothetical protein J7E38_13715 [Bacillus sp. ISL-35]|uniref:hypothetical protein n=1 Tax=Bacillus sp. ISL-35 TaxID=2819122 RepID=UPI001BE7F400|nr:hypothetical protein [Bacillus sp. ISL-35]MBT2680067.1 hypothetical protein [Bacillus sp. ISL-35]MBT2702956.1 hypothetical protein [Chryseobacterium sp. ISL-80]